MNESGTVQGQVSKVVTVWAAIGITSWADAASFVAFVYSSVLLAEWAWKRIVRPAAERRGLLKPIQQAGVVNGE